MNDAFIKLNLPSHPAPHYMGGEVLYHLGETTTPQTTLRPLRTSSFSKNQGEKVFTTQQYVKTYSQVLRDRKKQPSKTNVVGTNEEPVIYRLGGCRQQSRQKELVTSETSV